ncbi:hypothetical protein ABZU32_25040 [Sphaerisporangium sp. NPDC005288]|uniref:hypothetical protein n=1 Tax=Sphaerisporangium sp. NPDC005288 TaxID=3155114 RepID=UPI0033BBF115
MTSTRTLRPLSYTRSLTMPADRPIWPVRCGRSSPTCASNRSATIPTCGATCDRLIRRGGTVIYLEPDLYRKDEAPRSPVDPSASEPAAPAPADHA